MYRIVKVEPLEHYCLTLTFADGVQGTVDLSHLAGRGVFAHWNDYDLFRQVRIGDTGELVWSDEVDLCPDALYLQVTGKKAEDLFPGLQRELTHA